MSAQINWDSFDDQDDTGITDEAKNAADVPKACSIDNPECEACQ